MKPEPKLFSLYSHKAPPPAVPLYCEQPLAVAKQILSGGTFNRLDALKVGEQLTTFDGYIWERTA